ncbi:MAG: eIF2A-related protein [Microcoleus sp.]
MELVYSLLLLHLIYLRKAITEAIEQPAEKHAIRFESGLVAQIIRDVVNQAGALPLLQYALAELWRVCVTDSNQGQTQLTFEGYKQIKGVKGALEKRADELYQNLAEADQKFVRCLFLELVQLGENQEVTRRRASWQDLLDKADSQEQLERVTRQLANWNQRLIITDENKVEVAHEALLSEWRRLREWIEDNRDNIRLERRLEGDCQEWNKQNRPEGLLLAGTWLAAIDDWVKKEQPRLSLLKSEFLRESLGRRDRQIQEKVEQERKRTRFAIASLIAMTGLTMLAGTAWINAQRGQILALSQASEAKFILNRNSLDPLVEALKAATRLKQIDWVPGNKEVREQVMETLTQAVYWVRERDRIQAHNDTVQSVSFSPDGTMLASAGYDNTVKLWNLEKNQKKPISLPHNDSVFSVNFSPDSKIIASASFDKNVKLWNRDGTLKDTLPHDNLVYSVTFISNDRIATGDKSGKVTFWNSTNGEKIDSFQPHKKTVFDLRFNKQENMLASASQDGTVKLWKLTPKVPPQNPIILQHNSSVNSVSFSHDGQMIATASQNKIVRFWKLNGTPLSNLTIKGESGFTSVSFSPDKKTIATANLDGQVQLWEQNEKETKKIETLSGHTSRVKSVSFNKKGDILASASGDRTVRLWQVKLPLVTRLQADSQKVFYVSFSPDGQKFASAGQDNAIQIWDKNGKWQQSLIGHTQQVNSVEFSPPNGDKIASSSRDDTVKLWTWQGKQYQLDKNISRQSPLESSSSVSFNPIISNPLLAFADSKGTVKILGIDGRDKNEFLAHKREIWTVIFSPNGDYMATASGDFTAKLWDLKGKPKATLEGHDAAVQDITFHPQRNLIATASEDKTVKLWNLNGQLLKNITGHSDQVTSVRFSPDGNTIATASDDRTIKLWNLDGTIITTLKGHSGAVNSISFNPTNSKILISGSSDGSIIIWRELENLTLEGLLERGCKHLHGYLQTNPQAPQNICK